MGGCVAFRRNFSDTFNFYSMGSGNSRGKKVAPASQTDADGVTADHSAQIDGRVLTVEPLKVQPVQPCIGPSLVNNMTLDNQSVGQFSDSSTDLEGDVDEILADSDGQECRVNKNTVSKKHFFSSKTFGLCNYIKVRNDDDDGISTRQTPQGAEPRGGGPCHRAQSEMDAQEKQVCNKPLGRTTCANVSQKGWTATVCPETQPKDAPPAGQESGDADGPSFDKSVILYDATEEDLMKRIEREFN